MMGLELLIRDKKIGGRQRVLLINLTCTVLLYLFTIIVQALYETLKRKVHCQCERIFMQLITIEYISRMCIMLVVTCDHFLSCVCVYRYRVMFTKKQLAILIITIWMSAATLALLSLAID